jgi:hypothetical protein
MADMPGTDSDLGTSDGPQGVSGELTTVAGLPDTSSGPSGDSGFSDRLGGSAFSASLPDLERMPSSLTLSSHDSCGISVGLATMDSLLGSPNQESSSCSPGVAGRLAPSAGLLDSP